MKDLLRTARLNSILLTIAFIGNVMSFVAAGSPVFAVIGAVATVLTIRDVIKFNQAIKEN